jgi:hypothetical protein
MVLPRLSARSFSAQASYGDCSLSAVALVNQAYATMPAASQ